MGRQVVIVDTGGANIRSLVVALKRLDADCNLTSDPAEIQGASHVLLPGVGAAADAMKRLRAKGLTDVIAGLACPVLGICLGMQLLAENSEEDDADCLGVLPGTARALPASPHFPVPHMGWSQISIRGQHPLLHGITDASYFYFVHSYVLPVADYTIATAEHGVPFSAVISSNNFHATQFHPERSSDPGSLLLQNFLRL